MAFGTNMFKYIIYDDPKWDYSKYQFANFDQDTARAAEILNATDVDLTKFQASDGKLILWNGWSDSAITALGTIGYYEWMAAKDKAEVNDYARLFLLPGVLHCAGGPGPDKVDWLDRDQRLGREGQGARPAAGLEDRRQRQDDPDAAAVPVSPGRGLRRQGEHVGGRELRVRHALAR